MPKKVTDENKTGNGIKTVPPKTDPANKTDSPQRNKAPIKLELVVTIVDKKKAEFYIDLLRSFDVNFQFYALASGTAKSEVLTYLGLTETDKLVIFSIAREDRIDDIMYTLQQKFSTIKGGKGISVTIPFTSIVGTSIYTFLCNAFDISSGGAAK